MEQSKQIPVAWREIVLIMPLALLLHGAAWCFWWGVEGREMVVSSERPVVVSSPSKSGQRYLAHSDVLVNNAKRLAAETDHRTH
jgi:hypothetical protein